MQRCCTETEQESSEGSENSRMLNQRDDRDEGGHIPYLLVSAHLLHVFVSSSLLLIPHGGGRCPPTALTATCSSRHIAWLNQCHSLYLCSNFRFLGKLTYFTSGSHSWCGRISVNPLLWIRWKLRKWLWAIQKLKKMSTVVAGKCPGTDELGWEKK